MGYFKFKPITQEWVDWGGEAEFMYRLWALYDVYGQNIPKREKRRADWFAVHEMANPPYITYEELLEWKIQQCIDIDQAMLANAY